MVINTTGYGGFKCIHAVYSSYHLALVVRIQPACTNLSDIVNPKTWQN